MKKVFLKLGKAVVLAMLVVAASFFLAKNWNAFRELDLVEPWTLPAMVLGMLINYILISQINRELLRPLGVELGFLESYALAITGGFYNIITPFRGGLAARAVYLKRKYDFSYANFAATVSASHLLMFLLASFAGLLATIFISYEQDLFSPILFFIFLGLFLPLIFLVTFSVRLSASRFRWMNRLLQVVEGWYQIKRDRRALGRICALSLFQILIGAGLVHLSFRAIGFEMSAGSAILLNAMRHLSFIIGITPAGLGIQETVTVFSALAIGVTAVESLTASLILRGIQIAVLFSLGPIFSYFLLRNIRATSRQSMAEADASKGANDSF